jgi:hypothetical protein
VLEGEIKEVLAHMIYEGDYTVWKRKVEKLINTGGI